MVFENESIAGVFFCFFWKWTSFGIRKYIEYQQKNRTVQKMQNIENGQTFQTESVADPKLDWLAAFDPAKQ